MDELLLEDDRSVEYTAAADVALGLLCPTVEEGALPAVPVSKAAVDGLLPNAAAELLLETLRPARIRLSALAFLDG